MKQSAPASRRGPTHFHHDLTFRDERSPDSRTETTTAIARSRKVPYDISEAVVACVLHEAKNVTLTAVPIDGIRCGEILICSCRSSDRDVLDNRLTLDLNFRY